MRSINPAFDGKDDDPGGLTPGQINSVISGVTSVLDTTADTILGIIQSNNAVRIAELNAEAAQAIAQINAQLGIGGQTPAQRQQLEQQQQDLMRLRNLLTPPPVAAQDNTMLYVGLAAVAAFLFMQMKKDPAPARRNPSRRRRSRGRR